MPFTKLLAQDNTPKSKPLPAPQGRQEEDLRTELQNLRGDVGRQQEDLRTELLDLRLDLFWLNCEKYYSWHFKGDTERIILLYDEYAICAQSMQGYKVTREKTGSKYYERGRQDFDGSRRV